MAGAGIAFDRNFIVSALHFAIAEHVINKPALLRIGGAHAQIGGLLFLSIL